MSAAVQQCRSPQDATSRPGCQGITSQGHSARHSGAPSVRAGRTRGGLRERGRPAGPAASCPGPQRHVPGPGRRLTCRRRHHGRRGRGLLALAAPSSIGRRAGQKRHRLEFRAALPLRTRTRHATQEHTTGLCIDRGRCCPWLSAATRARERWRSSPPGPALPASTQQAAAPRRRPHAPPAACSRPSCGRGGPCRPRPARTRAHTHTAPAQRSGWRQGAALVSRATPSSLRRALLK